MNTHPTERPVFGDDAVQLLARQLREIALMDPVDLLNHLSEGKETPLPKFHVESDVAPKLLSWNSIQIASPERLTPSQYQNFLEGASPDVDLHFEKDVVLYLRESKRDWLIFAGSSVAIVIIGAVASFALDSVSWLQGIVLGYAILSSFSSYRIAKQSRSLSIRNFEALRNLEALSRTKSRAEIKTSS